jgi:Na+/pantothenate symporter
MVALLSAIMSNVNAILLVASAGISHDVFGKFINRHATERAKLKVNRASIVILSLLPVWFALNRYTDVQSIVVVQTRVIARFFFVPMIMGLNTKGGSSRSAVAAMLGGVVSCLAWSIWAVRHTSNIDAVEVGIAASFLCYLVANAVSKTQLRLNLANAQV